MDRYPMSSSPNTQAEILLIKASEDEAALHADGNPDAVLGFHAQQAVEKLIKSILKKQVTICRINNIYCANAV
jgi:HEPN domain-containing protein